MSKVPILGDIPIVGWLFRNKQKVKSKSNLLIFISPHIIHSNEHEAAKNYTHKKTTTVKGIMDSSVINTDRKDPITNMFFNNEEEEEFGFLNNPTPHEHLYDARKKRAKKYQHKNKDENTQKELPKPSQEKPKKQSKRERLKANQDKKKQQRDQA